MSTALRQTSPDIRTCCLKFHGHRRRDSPNSGGLGSSRSQNVLLESGAGNPFFVWGRDQSPTSAPFLARPPLTRSGGIENLFHLTRHDYRRFLVEHRQAILAHAELGAVVVPAARIEIDEHLSLFEGCEERRERKALAPHRLPVPIGFLAPFCLDLRLNIKCVEQLGPGFVFEIGKTPIRLRIKLAEPYPLPASPPM